MKILLILALVWGCSRFETKPPLSETSKEVAEWIYSPYEACQESEELCATGEGKSYAEADAQAKANLASIFEVKIQSDFHVESQSSQTFPWQSQVREEVRQSLQQSVDQVLETVQVKKHLKKEGLSYALASLDRAKAGDLLGSRLSKIDQELSVLWEEKQRTNMRKIVRLFLEREKLNERYSIVAGHGRPAKMSYADILKWRQTRPVAEPLQLKTGEAPDWLKEKVEELLTESGFKLVRGEAKKTVTLQVESIKEFLNVAGFEKYTFTLNLVSFAGGEKKKVVSTSETVTGRSQADALLKIKEKFSNYIEEHLSDLHLD